MKPSLIAAWGAATAVAATLLLSAVPLADNAVQRYKSQQTQIRDLQNELETLRLGHGELWQEAYVLDSRLDENVVQFNEQGAMLIEQGNHFEKQDKQYEERIRTLEDLNQKEDLATQHTALVNDILSPVFQLSGEGAVGSGVLIHRGEDEDGPYYLALSCYHVIRDILGEQNNSTLRDPVEARFDRLDGSSVWVDANMIAEDLATDLALLRLRTDEDFGKPARLAPAERHPQINVFTDIYNVGCPLGTAAQATKGEISRTNWDVDGIKHWMISSPGYFGNSGGGVFLSETHELVGIFTKIYTHGTTRPQVITHMGLSVPLDVILNWLQSEGYGAILQS